MTEDATPNENSPAVHAHLSIVQAVIARMADSSRSCKTWCVTIISAILVLGAGMTEFDHLWIAYVPLVLFLGLDMYYLALERRFRESYNAFLHKLRNGDITVVDLYEVTPAGSAVKSWTGDPRLGRYLALLPRPRRRDRLRLVAGWRLSRSVHTDQRSRWSDSLHLERAFR